MPWWMRIVPFFLSAFLFMSGFFAIFSPLPLLYLFLNSGRKWAWLAAVTNGALVFLGGGEISFYLYFVFVQTLSLSLPEFLIRRRSVEAAGGFSLIFVAAAGALVVLIHTGAHPFQLFNEISGLVGGFIDTLFQSVPSETRTQWLGGGDLEEWKQGFMAELPSAVGVFAMILVWVNTVAVLRMNPKGICQRLGIDASYFRRWKAPEYLLWPVIVCGFLLLVDFGIVSTVALNVFKFLMAIYAIQGLSILSYFFDVWNVRGIFRVLAYVLAVFLMMPLLLSLGFFDLWFDFRAKLRQS